MSEKNLLAERLKAFEVEMPPALPVYDRIFVWPIADSDKYKGSLLYKPEVAKAFYGASRGLLIAGGLMALDQLYGHGIELGHIVWYARLSPWRRVYEGTGKICQVTVLRAFEIVGSEDLMAGVREGSVEIGQDETGRHVLSDRADKRIDPKVDLE